MPKKISLNEVLDRFKKIHGDEYDYSKVDYKNRSTKVEIICPIHGSFFQLPSNHLTGQGCPNCRYEKLSAKVTKSCEEVIAGFKKVHANKYDYSKVHETYKNTRFKVEIICPKHGSFFQLPSCHLAGNGCPKCKNVKTGDRCRFSREEIIARFKKVHGDRYDYSKVVYKNQDSKVEIICPIHGSFYQIVSNHLLGHGCAECGGSQRKTSDIVIDSFKEIHGDRYDYSKVKYKNSKSEVEIICPEHGSFFQIANNHLKGQGCPKCKIEKMIDSQEVVIDKFKKIHGDRYDYSKVNYVNSKTKVEIICPIHGSFFQKPNNHLVGNNCPMCSHINSQGERDILNYIQKFYSVEKSNRKVIFPKELDIYVSEKNLAIEYNGLFWHSERYRGKDYHLDKLNDCNEKGIRLIQIFEDEWLYKQKIVKARLKHLLGCTKNKIYARKCVIKEVSSRLSKKFLEKYHIQGDCKASIRLGLYYKNRLVALMTFGKSRFNKNIDYELLRYCTVANFNILGGASKLLAHFKKNYQGSIISYADKRWSNGNLYKQLGFEELKDSPPNYFYFERNKRYSRNKFQKHKLEKLLEVFDPELSESENMKNNGYEKIWDCGNKVYILK